jgi:hypothetical protein
MPIVHQPADKSQIANLFNLATEMKTSKTNFREGMFMCKLKATVYAINPKPQDTQAEYVSYNLKSRLITDL